jgi:DNA-directed RNA polymerase subunit beta
MGFVETPYRSVKSGKVSKTIKFLSADEEDRVTIAQANTPINPKGEFQTDRVKCRNRADFPVAHPDGIEYHGRGPVANRVGRRCFDSVPRA